MVQPPLAAPPLACVPVTSIFHPSLGLRTVREPSESTTALDTVCWTSRVRSCSAQCAGWRCEARVARCSASRFDAWQIARGVRITFGRRTTVSSSCARTPMKASTRSCTDAPVRKRYDRGHKRGLDDVAGDQHALKFLQACQVCTHVIQPDVCAVEVVAGPLRSPGLVTPLQSLQCNSRSLAHCWSKAGTGLLQHTSRPSNVCTSHLGTSGHSNTYFSPKMLSVQQSAVKGQRGRHNHCPSKKLFVLRPALWRGLDGHARPYLSSSLPCAWLVRELEAGAAMVKDVTIFEPTVTSDGCVG